jgi:hypothetical protein
MTSVLLLQQTMTLQAAVVASLIIQCYVHFCVINYTLYRIILEHTGISVDYYFVSR